jgi:hypothetical protein
MMEPKATLGAQSVPVIKLLAYSGSDICRVLLFLLHLCLPFPLPRSPLVSACTSHFFSFDAQSNPTVTIQIKENTFLRQKKKAGEGREEEGRKGGRWERGRERREKRDGRKEGGKEDPQL